MLHNTELDPNDLQLRYEFSPMEELTDKLCNIVHVRTAPCLKIFRAIIEVLKQVQLVGKN